MDFAFEGEVIELHIAYYFQVAHTYLSNRFFFPSAVLNWNISIIISLKFQLSIRPFCIENFALRSSLWDRAVVWSSFETIFYVSKIWRYDIDISDFFLAFEFAVLPLYTSKNKHFLIGPRFWQNTLQKQSSNLSSGDFLPNFQVSNILFFNGEWSENRFGSRLFPISICPLTGNKSSYNLFLHKFPTKG